VKKQAPEFDTSGTVELLHDRGHVASVWKWSDLTELSQAKVKALLLPGEPFSALSSDDLYRIINETRRQNQKKAAPGYWAWSD